MQGTAELGHFGALLTVAGKDGIASQDATSTGTTQRLDIRKHPWFKLENKMRASISTPREFNISSGNLLRSY